MMVTHAQKPWGYRWRSSKTFILSIVFLALFADTFLYGFLVPILSYMLEVRLKIDPSQTQSLTSSLLAIHGFMTLVAAPIIAHFADKTSNRRIPLLIALVACAAGTVLVACTPSRKALDSSAFQDIAVWALFVGRLLQGVAGSATWIVGFATMVDNVGMDHIGKTMGLSMTFVMTGVIGGPKAEEATSRGFYLIALRDIRVVTGLASVISMSSIICGFDATLPLHLRNVFGWGSLPVGMTFLVMQIPSIVLSPVVGWLRDRVGLKYPTAVGWALLVPLIWLMGVPGDSHFPWANPDKNGKTIFIFTVVAVGVASTMVRGAGAVQMTNLTLAAVNEIQLKNPKIFGEHGGNSRISSMIEVSFSLGMVIGPVLSGSLTELVGYYYMSLVFALKGYGNWMMRQEIYILFTLSDRCSPILGLWSVKNRVAEDEDRTAKPYI
ncbi:membrane transporter [Microsporum canis CBS 113480]|uniref:Membrane transporter n=1 Tax=Arthroderma otae (strain ATCC MYA-4605 / CBS 113480) TaxID=554155 RepID=C5FYG2_ARTOC|nr:membrane transporter [Microsporum canis CBS 113480]EEQ34560.1 membrane transporter [Microsporum canis CBS 113480]